MDRLLEVVEETLKDGGIQAGSGCGEEVRASADASPLTTSVDAIVCLNREPEAPASWTVTAAPTTATAMHARRAAMAAATRPGAVAGSTAWLRRPAAVTISAAAARRSRSARHQSRCLPCLHLSRFCAASHWCSGVSWLHFWRHCRCRCRCGRRRCRCPARSLTVVQPTMRGGVQLHNGQALAQAHVKQAVADAAAQASVDEDGDNYEAEDVDAKKKKKKKKKNRRQSLKKKKRSKKKKKYK
eukprot:NODE_6156_length_1700_cov_2.233948.p1 GENE.NODE_6156_length_1700_cov_2.233948~~NODE_6156_length_1700_cov_2.233948.p1  ORF type:complete len:242 (+),score=56.70 NODE_6156_length_1700_cov_2.233948:897-1622(+)